MIKFSLLVAACLALTACGSTVSGSPVPVPSSSSTAVPPTTTKVPRSDVDAELIELRKIDSCALLDPQTAAKVTGDSAKWMMPSGDFGECKLVLAHGKSESWSFQALVGQPWIFDEAPKVTVGGLSFARTKAVDDYCNYQLRFRQHSTITLSVNRPYEDHKTDPCSIGQKYLETAAKTWSQPPLRSEGRTTPNFPLAAVDPCDAADLDKNLGWTPHPISPYQCDIGTGTTKATVMLLLDEDPEKLVSLGSRNAQAVTVAGRPGCVADSVGGGYEVRVRFADQPAVDPFATQPGSALNYQVVSVMAGDQATAQAVAGQVLDAAARQPEAGATSSPAAGAVPLGDLTGR